MAAGTGEPISVRWSGVVRDPGLAPGWMEQIVYAYATRETLAALGGPTDLNELRITAATDRMSREHARRLAATVRAMLEEEGRPMYEVVVPEPGHHIHAAQMDSLFYTQVTFGLLALALSGLLVFNLITALMAGQVRQIGMMKAVGARPDQVAALYLSLALLLGLLAAAPSLPLAAVIGRAYAGFAAGLLNFDVAGYPIPRSLLLLQLILAVLIPVVAAAGPVVRGSRMTVARAIRDYGIEGGSQGRGLTDRLLASVVGVTRPVLLSLRNAFRRRFRMAITLVTLALGGAVFLGALNLRSSIRGVVASAFEPLRYDLAIGFAERHSAGEIESTLAALPQVRRAEAWTSSPAASVDADGVTGERFTVIGLPPGSGMAPYAALDGRWLQPGDTLALVVNDRLLIGAANGAIYSIVLMEGLTIGLLSWALAVPLSIPMTRVVTAGFGRIMFEAPLVLVPAGGAVIGWLVLVAVVSALATLHPARTAITITTADALAYD